MKGKNKKKGRTFQKKIKFVREKKVKRKKKKRTGHYVKGIKNSIATAVHTREKKKLGLRKKITQKVKTMKRGYFNRSA